ncbi:MAG: phosphomannomutase/phosphoglucomutase [Bdellovibrionales bacterium]|nr:phosphomannomutase/phosphoglucomutase [Bdellovibrionales bacterium]
MNNVIFREYDIRGIYNEDFDLDFAELLGRGLVTFFLKKRNIKNPTITIGYDARLSSPDIAQSLAKGILKSGGNVIHLGLVTTPISYFSTFSMDQVDGSFMVTGSHNPPEYNGFKVSVGKTTIFGEEIQELGRIVIDQDFLEGGGTETTFNIFPSYLERYREEFKEMKNVPVVIDCGNGAAGCIARDLYTAANLNPVVLFEEPDGRFPNHHPDPTVEHNLEDLKKAVIENKAIAGIGFDGDADRIGLVDNEGTMIYGDELIALCCMDILEKHPGEPIIGDVKCSDRLYDHIARHGGKPIMWMTGHSLIKNKIKSESAPFGGELSGHIFFADRNYGYDDALYAGLRVIEVLSKSGKTVKELLKEFPKAYNTPEIRIDTTEEKKYAIVDKLKEIYSEDTDEYKINLIDGVRISFKNGWALARASNTQPVLVLRFEALSEKGLNEIREKIESIVRPML